MAISDYNIAIRSYSTWLISVYFFLWSLILAELQFRRGLDRVERVKLSYLSDCHEQEEADPSLCPWYSKGLLFSPNFLAISRWMVIHFDAFPTTQLGWSLQYRKQLSFYFIIATLLCPTAPTRCTNRSSVFYLYHKMDLGDLCGYSEVA